MITLQRMRRSMLLVAVLCPVWAQVGATGQIKPTPLGQPASQSIAPPQNSAPVESGAPVPKSVPVQSKAPVQTKASLQTKIPPPARITLEQAGSRTGRDRVPVYEGREVVVTGQVSAKPIWITDSYYVAIQDEALFGLLLRPEIPQLPDLTPGDWVEAQGTMSKRAGLPVLLP